jgi:hypothetical protein
VLELEELNPLAPLDVPALDVPALDVPALDVPELDPPVPDDAGLGDEASDGGDVADDPIAADAVGAGPLFEVHALINASATHTAPAAVVTLRLWWR